MPASWTSSASSRPASARAPSRVRCCRSRNSSVAAILNATALAAMTCSSGPPCWPGNTALLIFLASSAVLRMTPPRGPPSVLWVVVVTTSGERHRVGVQPGGDQAGEVGHVDHQVGADQIGDPAELGEVEM